MQQLKEWAQKAKPFLPRPLRKAEEPAAVSNPDPAVVNPNSLEARVAAQEKSGRVTDRLEERKKNMDENNAKATKEAFMDKMKDKSIERGTQRRMQSVSMARRTKMN